MRAFASSITAWNATEVRMNTISGVEKKAAEREAAAGAMTIESAQNQHHQAAHAQSRYSLAL
jgi:hypothetical protein